MSLFDKLKRLFGRTSHNGDAMRNGGAGEDGGMAGVEMISCHDALTLVHEYLDDELAEMPRTQVKAHFDVCQQCYPHLHLETVFRDTMRRALSGESAPPELKSKLLDLLSEAESEG